MVVRRRTRRVAVFAVTSALVTLFADVSFATNFITNGDLVCTAGPTANTPCMTDTLELSWNSNLGPRYSTAVLDSLYNSYDTTDLTVSPYGVHDNSVDVFYATADLPGDAVGRYQCVYPVPNNTYRCNHGHVTFDGAMGETLSDYQLKSVACHETGHSVGLTHGQDAYPVMANSNDVLACLQTPLAQVVPTLGTHNTQHINANY